MDANELIYKNSLSKSITAIDGLNMNEVVGTFTVKNIGATFFIGSNPIDAVWATQDIVMVGACVMPAGYGVSNHRLFVLKFLTSSLIEKTPRQIIRSSARRLKTRIPSTKDNYSNVMENLVVSHRLTERMVAAHNTSSSILLVKEIIDIIYQEGFQCMHHSDLMRRHIYSE